MKFLLGMIVGAVVAGCASVEVHYADAPAFDDVDAAAERASAGLSYYGLAKIHVAVAPSSLASGAFTGKPGGGTMPQAKDLPPAGAKPTKGTPANTKPAAGMKPSGTGTTTASNPEAGSGGLSGSAVGGDASNSSNGPQAPTSSTMNVGGLPWTVTLTTVSDATHGFMMGGTNGFWRKTALTASRAPNSDRPDSVTVKAENLTATRLGQIATVLGYVISPGASKGISGDGRTEQPPPFDFDVDAEHINATNAVADGSEWSYRLDIPTPNPNGAVSFDKAIAAAKTSKTVNYFPVPACLPGQLYIYKAGVQMADFPLVVANPDVVRLEPLPLDGKLTLSSICGASVQGATQVDPYNEVFSDLAALQKAYGQVTKPTNGKTGQ